MKKILLFTLVTFLLIPSIFVIAFDSCKNYCDTVPNDGNYTFLEGEELPGWIIKVYKTVPLKAWTNMKVIVEKKHVTVQLNHPYTIEIPSDDNVSLDGCNTLFINQAIDSKILNFKSE